ncbi:nucleoside hydrolase [Brevundimonas sp. NIBR11]|uniref:nucleoside hydrolase n=1 Tax=Brevundimonas sp. NIBR11 TaxID=3015999 RepID=UPI0022F0F316|nr:nucleoside hydrolase [Brevundimonas sp. NIBR11]WGM32178.1 Pyrimidine-specific ribonucleoside hydrolase RihA [Brevundimonas sp. NIBR11]
MIIDCDPGVDDAVGLLLAFASPELELKAITTVGGNVPVEKTTRNARIIRHVAGRDDVPVYAGAARPLRRDPAGAGEFHGAEGLGDLEAVEPDAPAADGLAVDAIVRIVMAEPAGSVALAVMGPMTNVALALRAEPRLVERLGTVVVMGGARSEGGNITPSAEFNIWADPDAAAEVFASGVEMVAMGLDVTHTVRATEQRIQDIEAVGTPRAGMAAAMLRFSQRVEREIVGWPTPDWGAPLHDPCTVAWLLRPDLFELTPCRIEVETESELTRGHTAVEFRVDPKTARHRWAVGAASQEIFDLITARLGAAA